MGVFRWSGPIYCKGGEKEKKKMYHIGIDVHKSKCVVAIKGAGRKPDQRRSITSQPALCTHQPYFLKNPSDFFRIFGQGPCASGMVSPLDGIFRTNAWAGVSGFARSSDMWSRLLLYRSTSRSMAGLAGRASIGREG